MKKLLTITSIILASVFATKNADAQQYQYNYNGYYNNGVQYASANSNYQMSKYDRDFVACSGMARRQSVGMSDAMYLGFFYGCMMNQGHANVAQAY